MIWSLLTVKSCTLAFVCWGQDSVEQPVREKTSAEGDQVTLLCNYTIMSSANAYLFWYKQLPNRSPTFILSNFSIGKGTTDKFGFHKERFSGDLNTISKSFPLTIQDVHGSDSAVYYCALQPTVTETHSTLIQNSE
uniref:Ig-like domain-containing protein n=1 Tax=Cyprinus carpio TaxID=7962 RepID=A0A8C1QVB8_CYPCA